MSTEQNTDKTLPERAFAEHPWPSNDKSEAIAVWRSAYTKALGEREAYKAHAEKLAEALREIQQIHASTDTAYAIAAKALAAYESEVRQ